MPAFKFAQIDAFATRAFAGNPACIIPTENFPDDHIMQSIAAENNVSETAFLAPAETGGWYLRWFTPTMEVPLCGHATLAAAHWLFSIGGHSSERIIFHTRWSGQLSVRVCREGQLEMDFPAPEIRALSNDEAIYDALASALGERPVKVFDGPYIGAVFENPEQIFALSPDLAAVKNIGSSLLAEPGNVGCLAFGGTNSDVTSRFFAPGSGIDEDPATGSWHCMVARIVAPRLSLPVTCFQAFPGRGAMMTIALAGDRVKIQGSAVTVIEGIFRY
ncbi:MAG: PhzF family phenazine biosynthesis protein [Hyphomonadaceae bacterium]|nr:PhzF family phenazine biosynthesis protein [Hyphomonadaceae bacterium]OUX94291.1 MAG: PhzF family phenazine biosynthesis protein [Hyphomonas sp. TMED17]CAI8343319.1 MAG: Trans-2,3-dihydro-3-hydroxyanthranilate isomerase [Hyphomonas sp. TMED17]